MENCETNEESCSSHDDQEDENDLDLNSSSLHPPPSSSSSSSLHHNESSSDCSSSSPSPPPQQPQQPQQQHSSQHDEDKNSIEEEVEEIDLENAPVQDDNNVLNNNNRVRQPGNFHTGTSLPDRPSFTRSRRLKTISEHVSVRSFSSHALNFEDSDDESMFHNVRYRHDNGDDHDDRNRNSRFGRFYGSSSDEDTKGTSSEDEERGSSSSFSRGNINIDKAIVRKVLDKSDERERKLKREKILNRFGCCSEKGSKRSLICLILTFGIVAVAFSVLSYLYGIGVFHDQKVKKKDGEGELGIFDDHGLYHNHIDYEQDLEEILIKPIPLSEGSFPSYISSNLANTIKQVGDITSYHDDMKMQQFGEDEIPFFWKTPFVGALMEEIFSHCFKFALASGGVVDVDMMPVIQRNPDEVSFRSVASCFHLMFV